MSNSELFTVGVLTPEASVQSIVVDGCKVTIHYNETSNPAVLSGIKEILSSAISASKHDKNLHK